MTVVLDAQNLVKVYGGKTVVSNVSLSMDAGEVVGLLGPNGAGKTTTFSMLYGAVTPAQGSVNIFGIDLLKEPGRARKHLGIVPQENNLDTDLSIYENLLFFGRYLGMKYREAEERARQMIDEIQITEWQDKKPEELSGGVVRRSMLARALLGSPDLVFLDEPTTGLDPDARQSFWGIIRKLKSKQRSVLLTTHYMEEAARLCDRVILLKQGRIISEGSPDRVVEQVIGGQVVEVSGVSFERLRGLLEPGCWISPYSEGYIAALPAAGVESVFGAIESYKPTRLVRRGANLEDVFLKLTGAGID